MSQSPLASLAAEYASVRRERKILQEQMDALEARETELQRSILITMASAGTSSTRIDGVGRLVVKTKTRYEIADKDKLALALLQAMVENAEQGRAMSDGLLLQQRVAARNFEERAENLGVDEAGMDAYAAAAGLRRVIEPSLTFTKETA